MENKIISELEQPLTNLDLDNIKLDAIIELKSWQKKMFAIIDKTYSKRLNEIDLILLNIKDEVKDKEEIDQSKYHIIINESISQDFHHLIEQTIRVTNDYDDDDLVIIDIDKSHIVLEAPSSRLNEESRASKIFHSEPVQQALTIGLTKTLTHMSAVAATSTTTMAATAMAKTALFTTACGLSTLAYSMGSIAIGTTKKVWSLVVSSHDS